MPLKINFSNKNKIAFNSEACPQTLLAPYKNKLKQFATNRQQTWLNLWEKTKETTSTSVAVIQTAKSIQSSTEHLTSIHLMRGREASLIGSHDRLPLLHGCFSSLY